MYEGTDRGGGILMKYSITKLSIDEAIREINSCSYIILYRYDGIELKQAATVTEPEIKDTDCFEIRAFSGTKEIHLFEGESAETVAIRIMDDEDGDLTADVMEKKYKLSRKYAPYTKVCIKEYLEYDEDGQMYVAVTRLSGIEG